ncbi:GyrI-like domain-containing protein [Echinicola salinicaeni]|uniref:GyrI-like domain-containing protein n=1 Tax=Echinicola salinicaeni TaxID=2762757 RepID=UPI001646CFD9|nr:GyrI-like domain-containing protein [Echinicola salinicaeni]
MQGPRIIHSQEKHFIGMHLNMSLSENKTFELWKRFMPRRKELEVHLGNELFSIDVYPEDYFKAYDPSLVFQKWAAVEVAIGYTFPEGMEALTTPEGLYAAFVHKGLASEGAKTYQYIFNVWLPQSKYQLDERPHFAVMGDKYKNDDPNSEEEIWVPVVEK